MNAPVVTGTPPTVERLHALFPGLEGSHGESRLLEQQEGRGKVEAISKWVHSPVTIELWEQHLRGKLGLGVAPLRRDGSCRFGAIDIDDYKALDWERLERELVRLELPLILCKSKSGGAHLYLFTSEAMPADLLRRRLTQWTGALGLGIKEIFPKQDRLLKDDDYGNWINMPYFGGDLSPRHAISNGQPLSIEGFLKQATAAAVRLDELQNFKLPGTDETDPLYEAPPCLQCLAKTGCPEGNRNKFLFNLGVYARNRFGDDYAEKLDAFNQQLMDSPLGHKEVASVVKSVGKKDYAYTCKDEPIRGVCDRETCLTRDFGVGGGSRGRRPTAIEIMLGAVTEAGGELWHTGDARTFLSLSINGRREHFSMKSTALRRFLVQSYGKVRGAAPNNEALQNIIALLDARAVHEGSEFPVAVRIAQESGAIYIDLANEAREAVRIDATGWEITTDVPVRFHRPANMKPLPRPERGGSVEALRPFVTVENEADWCLLVAFIVGCLRPRGPYPQLHISGANGSAKSMLARINVSLLDPRTPELRSAPGGDRDLMIYAQRTHLLAYDNLSHVSGDFSDALCRISTGGGLGTRTLYSDDDETTFDVMRPVILTGINEIAMRADLRDRALMLALPSIPADKYRDEETLWAEFNTVRPLVLGALYDAVSRALRDWSATSLESSPRMADFARWVTAAELGLGWERGTFLRVYAARRNEAAIRAVEQDVFASAISDLVDESDYELSPRGLLELLGNMVGAEVVRQPFWPKTPRALSAALKRAERDLLTVGVVVESGRGAERWISLTKVGRTGAPRNKPYVPSV
jgi:hypothetical protein